MPETPHRRAMPHRSRKVNKAAETELYNALASLNGVEELRRFLYDLCTPKEIADMADRWWVARLLNEGELSYRDIHQLTGVSVTTVGRVARFLDHEKTQGYRIVMNRGRK